MYKEKKIYLEDGDARGGLEHIMQNHEHDFERKLGVGGNQAVADKIKSWLKYGDWCAYGFQKDSRGDFTLAYEMDEKLYLLVVVSDKGFIVSSYPKTKLSGNWEFVVKKERKKQRRGSK